MSASFAAVSWTLVPALAAAIGGLIGLVWQPNAQTRSAIQHFTAGVVLAAVGAELLPELGHSAPWSMAIGFLIGGGAMLALRAVLGEGEAEDPSEGAADGAATRPGPKTGLLVAIGVDLAIDGMLCAVTLVAAPESGFVIVAALSLEVFFLGLATVVTLGGDRLAFLRMTGLALLVPIGGAIGATLFIALPGALKVGVLAFATAALLYLVAEELLAEAHEDTPDTPFSAATFFLGFLAVLLLKAVES